MKKFAFIIFILVTLLPSISAFANKDYPEYTEQELLDAGFEKLKTADGQDYFSGFFLGANGHYFPLNPNTVVGKKGQTAAVSNANLTEATPSAHKNISKSAQQPTAVKNGASDSDSSKCNPNYEGCCLPMSGKVHCTTIGCTNISVVGTDVFHLDHDHDGVGCESDQ